MGSDDSINLHPELVQWLYATLGPVARDVAASNPLGVVKLAVQKVHYDESGPALTPAALTAWKESLDGMQRDLRESYIAYAAEAVRQGVPSESIARTIQAPPDVSVDEWVAELEAILERTHPGNPQNYSV